MKEDDLTEKVRRQLMDRNEESYESDGSSYGSNEDRDGSSYENSYAVDES